MCKKSEKTCKCQKKVVTLQRFWTKESITHFLEHDFGSIPNPSLLHPLSICLGVDAGDAAEIAVEGGVLGEAQIHRYLLE